MFDFFMVTWTEIWRAQEKIYHFGHNKMVREREKGEEIRHSAFMLTLIEVNSCLPQALKDWECKIGAQHPPLANFGQMGAWTKIRSNQIYKIGPILNKSNIFDRFLF